MIVPVAMPAAPVAPAANVPRIVVPTPYQVSFGRLVAEVPGGTARVIVVVNGKRFTSRVADGRRVSFALALPACDSTLRVLAVDRRGRLTSSAAVGPVFGLPPAAAPRAGGSVEDGKLRRRLVGLLRAYPGTAAVYVRNLVTGFGTAWNARARFPAASTLKLAIAVEALRSLRGPPVHGSSIDTLMRSMLLNSDNKAANALEVTFGGSTSGGSARVNATLRALSLNDSEMYGGYEIDEGKNDDGGSAEGGGGKPDAARPIPIGVESQPSFPRGKYASAADFGRLLAYLHLAAGGRGPLIERFGGAFSPAEARYLLYVLVHVPDREKLGRFLPGVAVLGHKAGWIATARHDAGLVFWPGGAFVAVVMTWSGSGAGSASDILAGRVAQATLARLRALDGT
jgi:hypothetical protein